MADHVRTLSFAITDGAVPSNEGRGYVLRRILRRAVRYGVQTLGASPGFFSELVPVLVREMAGAYPELIEKQDEIIRIISEEEVAFTTLLQRGVKYFNEMIVEMKQNNPGGGCMQVSGAQAFFLYDTLGFPLDLTQIMATEAGVTVDVTGFQVAMQEQQTRSRTAARTRRLGDRSELFLGAEETAWLKDRRFAPTDDSAKYTWDQDLHTEIIAFFAPQQGGLVEELSPESVGGSDTVGVVLKETSFYAEAGGQEADSGSITVSDATGRSVVLDVIDTQVSFCPTPSLTAYYIPLLLYTI